MTGSSVDEVKVSSGMATVTVTNEKGTSDIECDTVLVAVGAQGNVDGIGLEAAGVEVERGYITIDDMMRTSVENIYAIGDVTGKMLLAHVASAQGVTAVEHMAGLDPQPLDYDYHPASHLLQAADRQLRSHGGAGGGARVYCEGREVPLHREREGTGACGV